jgi:hypothetical protein
MTDYLPLLSRAVAGLAPNTGEARRAVYDRARQALVNQLRAMRPPLAESEITRERLALEEAIRRIETQAGQVGTTVERPAQTAPEPPPKPVAPRAPAARPAPRTMSTPSPRERVAEAVSGSRVVRDAVAEAEHLGAATTATAQAARSNQDAIGGIPPGAFELDERVEPAAASNSRAGGAEGRAAESPAASEPRAFRPRVPDIARLDARKALKAKLVVGGIVVGLLLVAMLIGFVHRDRILASIGLVQPPAKVVVREPGEGPKIADRVTPEPAVKGRPATPGQPTSPPGSVAAVAQRAVLYEENPGGGQQLQTFVGTSIWRTETVNPGPGRPPELGLRVDVEIPDRRMTVTITIRRNPDTTLPASHTVEIQFTSPGDPFGGVANMPGLRAKSTETAQGAPLAGLVVRVMPGFFLIGLSALDVDRESNIAMLRERGWLDIPFVYNNGRRAVLVLEKGAPGERAMNEALMAWGG